MIIDPQPQSDCVRDRLASGDLTRVTPAVAGIGSGCLSLGWLWRWQFRATETATVASETVLINVSMNAGHFSTSSPLSWAMYLMRKGRNSNALFVGGRRWLNSSEINGARPHLWLNRGQDPGW
ncbi:hypothetical protein AAFF_G00193520 [Aldrovandia affinis]|uniref:Uncharacterized protein n=1 Tax=Aldrovandia affinis TaxID=143900 RepID=A0AAD7SY38_9TELE|nr:hypothetical protein AAFF_G00193520 [Aldrovandia affinis]